MVKHISASLDRTFSALSNKTRRAILARLAGREWSVTEVAAPFRMSLPAISKHLRVLEKAGLLARTKGGRVHHLRLVAKPLEEAADWIGRYKKFWDSRLDALGDYLEELTEKEKST